MFNVIGDIIEYEGERVAVIRGDVTPKLRTDLVDVLHEWSEPEDIDCDECHVTIDLRDELEAMTAKYEAQCTILGVKPCLD